jgi:hypothetical protein
VTLGDTVDSFDFVVITIVTFPGSSDAIFQTFPQEMFVFIQNVQERLIFLADEEARIASALFRISSS